MAEGGQLGPGGGTLSIANKCPHPHAAALFANWILTKEGQTVWSKGDEQPSARLDVATDWVHPTLLAEPNEKIWVCDEACYEGKPALMKEARQIFAPLLK
jgi:ABC-type glycerol-3-phosphate transport system substrate-binding protein